eukprot:4823279-Prymnesium_polylepis.1
MPGLAASGRVARSDRCAPRDRQLVGDLQPQVDAAQDTAQDSARLLESRTMEARRAAGRTEAEQLELRQNSGTPRRLARLASPPQIC